MREKLWVDVYVGSLYLPSTSQDIAEIYSNQGPYRIQLDFVYKKVSRDNLIEAWDEGFKKNQTPETLQAIEADLQKLYAIFDRDAVSGDQFIFDYSPALGVTIFINGEQVGRIEGTIFKSALLDIWLGNEPADSDLKRGMIGWSNRGITLNRVINHTVALCLAGDDQYLCSRPVDRVNTCNRHSGRHVSLVNDPEQGPAVDHPDAHPAAAHWLRA